MYEQARKAPDLMKGFVNTVLGLPFEEEAEAPEWQRLYERREAYRIGAVPEPGLFLTAGVDVQKDRIEVEASWDPAGAAARQPRTAVAVKRRDRDTALLLSVSKADAGGKRRGLRVWSVGTPVAKGELYRWLKLEWPTDEALEAGASFPPGACHFPQYGEEHFKQLTAERMVTRIVQGLPARLVGEGAGPAQRGARLPGLRPGGGRDLRPRPVRGAALAAHGGGVGGDRGARSHEPASARLPSTRPPTRQVIHSGYVAR